MKNSKRRGGDGFTCLHTINSLEEGSKEMLRDCEGKELLSSRIFLSHHHICLIISRSHRHSKTLNQPTPGKKHVWQSIVINGFMGHQDHLLILAVSLLSFSVFVYFVYVSHSLCTLGHKLPITDQICRSEVKVTLMRLFACDSTGVCWFWYHSYCSNVVMILHNC